MQYLKLLIIFSTLIYQKISLATSFTFLINCNGLVTQTIPVKIREEIPFSCFNQNFILFSNVYDLNEQMKDNGEKFAFIVSIENTNFNFFKKNIIAPQEEMTFEIQDSNEKKTVSIKLIM